MTLEAAFLSPIWPKDLLKQSAPVSYLSVSVVSKDGSEHDVQIYTDVSAGMYALDNTRRDRLLT